MESIKDVIKLIDKNEYLASLDIKDSYYLIPVDSEYRKYLKFQFENKLYCFNCLPFGLSSAPYVFTKLMKPVVEYLRSRGYKCVIYLDDLLFIAKTEGKCREIVNTAKELLLSLGFLLSEKKCQLDPKNVCIFLGFIIDSAEYSVYLTGGKREKILNLVTEFLQKKSCKIREAAQLIGTLISACPGARYGWLYTRYLERQKYLALKKSGGSFSKNMPITREMKLDLTWWKSNILTTKNPIRKSSYELEIFSDASLSGWGVVCREEKVNGWWSHEECTEHINILELKAVLYGLKCFAKDLRDVNILLRIDNTTAIAYVNKMGGIQNEKLLNLGREIWSWCEERNIWIFASYINTRENTVADHESRVSFKETEWELSPHIFEVVQEKFGPFDVDLFASKANAKCKRYCSWKRDPDSSAVDAFTIPWNNFYFYAFPPFSIILRVLHKIRNDKAEGTLIVPWWPTQSWFPLLIELAASKPIKFKPATNLLISSSREVHPLAANLSLAAVQLSGRRSH